MNSQNTLYNIGKKKSDFIFDNKILGSGNFAKVVKAKSLLNGLYYAIKIINKYENSSKQNYKYILREKYLPKILNHNNIVHYYGSFEDNENYYLVLEYIPNGSLEEKINNHLKCFQSPSEVEFIKEDIIINIFTQILNGLIYLHDENIIHRDIQPNNILFDSNNNIKITDFGLCALLNPNYINDGFISSDYISKGTKVGHKNYTCPEIVEGQKYNDKCDIFSLGITIFYLMSFDLPYISNLNKNNTQIKRIPKQIALSQVYSKDLRNLVERMISEDPQKRPTAKEAYNILKSIKDPSKLNFNNTDINISSFICIIRLLCSIPFLDFKNLKNNIYNRLQYRGIDFLKTYLPLNLCGMKEIIEYKNNSMINDLYFMDYIQKIRYLLSLKTERIYGKEEINPIIVLEELIKNFTSEFISQIPWNNNIFEIPNLTTSNAFPNFLFNDISNAIQTFKTNCAGPLVDCFYFLNGYITKCKNCNNTQFLYKIKFFLLIQTTKGENLNNLIQNYIYKGTLNSKLQCSICNSIELSAQRFFINSPFFLIIEFENKNQINIDEIIDITNYKLNNVGPSRYEFFALISEENINGQSHYICTIKENSNYIFYSDASSQKCGEEAKKYGTPYIVIYRGI